MSAIQADDRAPRRRLVAARLPLGPAGLRGDCRAARAALSHGGGIPGTLSTERDWLSASCLGIAPPLAPKDAGGPGLLADTGAFPYVDQYVPLRWRVMAPTKKRPPYPRGCDGADKPEHNLVHHCFASERRRHWASLQALGTIRCRPPAGRAVIPSAIDQNPCAHWRNPMDMIRQG